MKSLGAFRLFAFGLLGGVGLTSAQTGVVPDRFEVASIKPSGSTETFNGNEVVYFKFHHGGIIAKGMPLAVLIAFCFPDISEDRIINAPKWLFSAKFDVEAKPSVAGADDRDPGLSVAEQSLAVERVQGRMRALLEERFQLKTHRQTIEVKGFALVVGKRGATFLKSRLPDGSKGGAFRKVSPGQLAGPSASMPLLAIYLGQEVGVPVADKTGLSGWYNVSLAWTPYAAAIDFSASGDESPSPAADANGPSLFTAVQEQLGLKLVPEKQQVVLLVIDHVEKPSAN